MKFEVIDRKVDSAGEIETMDITLSANAKAFRIIFGQIYPDIIKAIVRELFTNAWDSQKVAGNLDTPIDIHLPSSWEPYFSIRDYGTGMTPQVIEEIYAKVFESSKDDSNEEAGMFGMGSKTPLGYTDSFTVMSYVDGVYYAYDIYIGKKGNPVLALKARGETDEPNGVLVTVSVKSDDFDKFKEYAETFALNAGTPININRERYLNKRTPMYVGDDWILLEPDGEEKFTTHIRMGCVLYRLDIAFLESNIKGFDSRDRNKISSLVGTPLIIDFPIGTFQVTGSREDISYNSEVANIIASKLIDIYDSIYSQISTDVAKQRSPAEAYRRATASTRLKLGFTMRSFDWHGWTVSELLGKITSHNRLKFKYMSNPFAKNGSGITSRFKREYVLDDRIFNKNVVNYIVIETAKTKSIRRRLENITDHVRKYRSKYWAYSTAPMYNFIWVYVDEITPRMLARINYVFQDTTTFIINADDIEPKKIVYARREVNPEDTTYRLRLGVNKYSEQVIMTSYGHEIVEEGGYYIQVDTRKYDEEFSDKVRTSAKALGVDLSDIHLIFKKDVKFIDKYHLVDLIEEADKVRKSIDYNDDTYVFWALYNVGANSSRPFRYWVNESILKSKLDISYAMGPAKMANVSFDPEKVDLSFIENINENVEKKLEEKYNYIINCIEEFYKEHPILNYVNTSEIVSNQNKILEAIGVN